MQNALSSGGVILLSVHAFLLRKDRVLRFGIATIEKSYISFKIPPTDSDGIKED